MLVFFIPFTPCFESVIQLPQQHAHQYEMYMEEVRLRQMEEAVYEHSETGELKESEQETPGMDAEELKVFRYGASNVAFQ